MEINYTLIRSYRKAIKNLLQTYEDLLKTYGNLINTYGNLLRTIAMAVHCLIKNAHVEGLWPPWGENTG